MICYAKSVHDGGRKYLHLKLRKVDNATIQKNLPPSSRRPASRHGRTLSHELGKRQRVELARADRGARDASLTPLFNPDANLREEMFRARRLHDEYRYTTV
jgi:hypothetical protein